MHALEQYLVDCESKRRRLRDRPSNQVLEELRVLLALHRGATTASAEAPAGAEAEDPKLDGGRVYPPAGPN